MSPVSRIVPKILRRPLCPQNVQFLVGRVVDKKQYKSPRVPEKRRSGSFEKIIGKYVSRKPNTRQKNEIFEQSHSAKNVKGGGYKHEFRCKRSKKSNGDPVETSKKISKKSLEAEKGGSFVLGIKVLY